MRIRRNDFNNDWCFGHSEADIIKDNNIGVAQNIKTKLQEWKYNFFANFEAGIDWRTRLGEHKQKNLLEQDIINIIYSIEEVLEIFNFESLIDDRQLSISFECYTIYSQQPTLIEVSIEV